MKKTVYFLLLIFSLCCSQTFAQPELDATFGTNGKLIVELPMIGSTANSFFLPDNKILQVGPCTTIDAITSIFCTFRMNENGSIDTTYGPPFRPVTTQIPGMNVSTGERGNGGAVMQNDGKIIAAGYGIISNQTQSILVRLNTDGSLDSTFGTNGVVNIAFLGGSRVNQIALQPDGKVLMVGFTGTTSVYQQYVARFNANGTLDSSFGSGGIVSITFPDRLTNGLSVAIQQDGKIVTGGQASTTASGQESFYLLARLNKDGSLDTSFDNDGLKTIPYSGSIFNGNGLRRIKIQSDGRILALSHLNVLYRFNSDGSLDTNFDGDGSRPALNAPLTATDFNVSASGKITVVGYPLPPNFPINYQIARYLPDGSLDTNFSDDGLLEIDINSSRSDATTVIDFDLVGRTFIAGYSAIGTVLNPFENPSFSNARLLASPVQNFGFSGRVTDTDGNPVYNASLTIQKGSNIIGYARTNPFGFFNFNNIPTNQTYKLSTKAKGLNFYEQSVLPDDKVVNYLVVGEKQ